MRYALILNDMREPNIENLTIVRVSYDPESLRDWYKDQKCDSWTDGRWFKSFKPGSELEWFNPAENLYDMNNYYGGIWTVPDHVKPGDGVFKVRR